jgi:hypothetical protein
MMDNPVRPTKLLSLAWYNIRAGTKFGIYALNDLEPIVSDAH